MPDLLNRYSLWLGAALSAVLGVALGAVGRPVAGLVVAAFGLLGSAGLWCALRTGASTLPGPAALDALIGAATPVLVVVVSDT